jgi:hypothetical protein
MELQHIDEFKQFVVSEVKNASQELEGLAEGSRPHLQKLVYTNLVDRFKIGKFRRQFVDLLTGYIREEIQLCMAADQMIY